MGIVDLESSDDAVSVRRCRDRHSAVEQQRRAERVDGVNNSVDDAGLNQLLGCESCDLPGHSVGRSGRAGHHDVTAHLDDSDPPRRRGSVGVRSDDQRIMRRESARCVRQVAPQGSDSISIGRQHSDEYVRNPSLDVSDLLRGTGRLERDGAVAGRERTQRRCGPGGSGSADARFGAFRFVSYRGGSPAPIRHRTSRVPAHLIENDSLTFGEHSPSRRACVACPRKCRWPALTVDTVFDCCRPRGSQGCNTSFMEPSATACEGRKGTSNHPNRCVSGVSPPRVSTLIMPF